MEIPPPFTPSQGQRLDSHTLHIHFPLFECLLFTSVGGTVKIGLRLRQLGSAAEKARVLKGGRAGAAQVSVGEQDGWSKRMR